MATSWPIAGCAPSGGADSAPVAALTASISPGSVSGPMTHGAMATRDAPISRSRITAPETPCGSSIEACMAGAARRPHLGQPAMQGLGEQRVRAEMLREHDLPGCASDGALQGGV